MEWNLSKAAAPADEPGSFALQRSKSLKAQINRATSGSGKAVFER